MAFVHGLNLHFVGLNTAVFMNRQWQIFAMIGRVHNFLKLVFKVMHLT